MKKSSGLRATNIKSPGYVQRDKKAKAKTRQQKRSRRINHKKAKQ